MIVERITSPTVAVAPELQPVDWKKADNAVSDWINSAITLQGGVVWEPFTASQPEYPYVSLFRSTIVSEGGVKEDRWRTLDVDGNVVVEGSALIPFDNEQQSYDPVKFTVSATAHMDLDAGGRDPSCDSMFLMSRAKAFLGLRSIVDAFTASGLSIVEDLDVFDTSVVINAQWVRKATLDVIFRTASVITEKVGFFDKVHLKSDSLDIDTIVDAST